MRTLPAFLALALLWGSEWIPASALHFLPQPGIAALRFLFASVVLLPFLLRKLRDGQSRVWLGPSALAGLLLFGVPSALTAIPLRTSASTPAVTLAMVSLLATLIQGESPALLPAALGLGGIAFLVGEVPALRSGLWAGSLLRLLEAISIAAGLAMAARRLRAAPLGASVCVQTLAAAILLLPLHAFTTPGEAWHARWAEFYALLALAGIAVPGAVLLLWLVQQAGPVLAGAVQWAVVLVAAGESAILFRQRPGWEMTLGASAAVFATAWLLRVPKEPEPPFTLGVTEVGAER